MKRLIAVAVFGFAGAGQAGDYTFKGTVDACLDKAGNWDPALETLTASDVLYVKEDTALKTLTLSADWSPNVKEWDVHSFTFDLGAGKTLTFPGTSEAFYITGGYHFNLTSGTLYSPNRPFTIGRWTPNIAFAEISGEGRFDIALKPLVEPFPAFIIEVKKADSPDDDLKALAREAREQIDGKKYDTAFLAEGISDIEKIGLAYCKDKVELCR